MKKPVVLIAYLAAALFAVLALLYFVTPASQLPVFLPGHDAASQAHHAKHGLAAVCLALGCAAYAWFQGGPKSAPEKETRDETEN
jgi:hypothetical protein